MQNVLLCLIVGGIGKRLWPLSTKNQPKQLLDLFDNKTLLELTLNRNAIFDNILIMYNHEIKDQILEVIKKYSFKNIFLIEEKKQIGTNICAIIASLVAQKLKLKNVILLPSDHIISNVIEYRQNLLNGIKKLQNKTKVIIFGIKPTFVSTEYGYIEYKKFQDTFYVKKFIEKPKKEHANNLIIQGFVWNSGIYIFNVNYIINYYNNNFANKFKNIKDNIDINKDNIDIKQYINNSNIAIQLKCNKKEYKKQSIYINLKNDIYNLKTSSFDVEIITNLANENVIKMIPANFDWRDIGSFKSIYELQKKDINNNVINSSYKIILKNVRNCYIFSDIKLKLQNLYNIILIIKNNNILIKDLALN
ncbi:MAG: sugar phosphate nucleotidyltransferase [Rickettsiales bacterium]